jgi:hypothetical protein
MTTMPNIERSGPSIDVQHQLEVANPQLLLYARDLTRIADAERHEAFQLTATYQQWQAYAWDLKTAFNAERSNTRGLEQAYHDVRGSQRPHATRTLRSASCGLPSYTPGVRGYRLLSAGRNHL